MLDLHLQYVAAKSRSTLSRNEAPRFDTLAQSAKDEIDEEIPRYLKILDRLAELSEPGVEAAFGRLRPAEPTPSISALPVGLAEAHWRQRLHPSGTPLLRQVRADFQRNALSQPLSGR